MQWRSGLRGPQLKNNAAQRLRSHGTPCEKSPHPDLRCAFSLKASSLPGGFYSKRPQMRCRWQTRCWNFVTLQMLHCGTQRRLRLILSDNSQKCAGNRRKGTPHPSRNQLKRVSSRMIFNAGGRGSCRATALRQRTARQEPRPTGIALRCELPKSATGTNGTS